MGIVQSTTAIKSLLAEDATVVATAEGLAGSQEHELVTSPDMTAFLGKVAKEAKIELSPLQKSVAAATMAFASSVESYKNGQIDAKAERLTSSGAVPGQTANIVAADQDMTSESFTGIDPTAYSAVNVAVNIALATQDQYVEAFLPSVLNTKGISGIQIALSYAAAKKPYLRDGNSIQYANEEIPLTEIIGNGEIFDGEDISLVPVVTGNKDLDQYLSVQYQTTETINGKELEVAPLQTGMEVPVMDVTTVAGKLTNGTFTDMDGLEASYAIKTLVGTLDTTKVKFDVSIFDGTTMTGTMSGDSKDFVIATTFNANVDFDKLKTIDGGNAVASGDTLSGYTGIYKITIMAKGNLETAIVTTNINMELVRVVSTATGTETTDSDILDAAGKLGFTAYYPDARPNLEVVRDYGIFITGKSKSVVLNVKGLTPIKIAHPISSLARGENSDATMSLDKALQLAIAQVGHVGSKVIAGAFEKLAVLASGGLDPKSLSGIGKFNLKPAYETYEVNFANMNTISQESRQAEIRESVINALRYTIPLLAVKSGYLTAYRAAVAQDAKLRVVVGVPAEISSFLSGSIDLGPDYEVKVVSTARAGFTDKIYATFVPSDSASLPQFSFGNTYVTPTLVGNVPSINASGGTVAMTVIQPLVTHEIHNYIGTAITLTGLKDALGKI